MISLMIVKDGERNSMIYRLFSFFFESEKYEFISHARLQELLEEHTPELVLTDINRPVSGNDLMSMVSTLDELPRLRAFHIYFILKRRTAFSSPFGKSLPQS